MSRRDEALRVVEDCLRQCAADLDFSAIISPAIEAAAVELAQVLDEVDGADDKVRWALGWIHWIRFGRLSDGEARSVSLETACSLFLPFFLVDNLKLCPEPLVPVLADLAEEEAWEALARILLTGDDAQTGVAAVGNLWARIVNATSEDHPRRASRLSNQSVALLERSRRLETPDDLDEAIDAARRSVAAASEDDPNRSAFLSNLGNALVMRFEQQGTVEDLEDAVGILRFAAEVCPKDYRDRPTVFSCLASALQRRFERFGETADLNGAVESIRQAVHASSPEGDTESEFLARLGVALMKRYERLGAIEDLTESVASLRLAVERSKTQSGLEYAHMLGNLGTALLTRFEDLEDVESLGEAIAAGRRAVQLIPADDRQLSVALSSLSNALQRRFERFGAHEDIDESVSFGRQAVETASRNSFDPASSLMNLANKLRTRYEYRRAIDDLDEAIEVYQAAVNLTPSTDKRLHRRLHNLSNGLRIRFDRTGVADDLERAVAAGRESVRTTPAGHPELTSGLNNLGVALQRRFELLGDAEDLNEAERLDRQAVSETPANHPAKTRRLSNLGNVLALQFTRLGNVEALNEAAAVLREAVRLRSEDDPQRADYLVNLGDVLEYRFKANGASADHDEALEAYASAAGMATAPPAVRIRGARAASTIARETDPERAARLLEAAILLFPELASRRLRRTDQYYAIRGARGIASDAAALVLSGTAHSGGERAQRALTLLEAGRGVLLSQSFETRNDLTDLRQAHPDLAKRLIDLRETLDQDPEAALPSTASAPSQVDGRSRASADLARLLADIRALDGFRSFGMPPTMEELLEQADQGPIVTFNVAAARGDALVLTAGGIQALELPSLTFERVGEMVTAFHQALLIANSSLNSTATRRDAQTVINDVLAWLWDAATAPVLEMLGYHSTPLDATWPRIWWVPGGLLGLLPLHASGHHRDKAIANRRTVLDRVVSSYTPTIRALRYARQHSAPRRPLDRALIVAMPTTPGLGSLGFVPAEAEALATLLPRPTVLIEHEPDLSCAPSALPTRQRVLGELSHHTIVHFACHGAHDPSNPAQSRLLLHDHQEAPLTVASLAPTSLEGAQLAFLSACETAVNMAAGLLDESVNLASAFQLAGFPQVIGTLWVVDDEVAVEIATDFYTALRNKDSGEIDTARAAYALHQAVRRQRNQYPQTPSLWAGHLHSGA